jgi:hypothetical protein
VDTEQIFWLMDKHASEFNFPVLDNVNIELAATRLSAFRGPFDWLVAFEVLGFSIPQVEFVNDLYAYGSSCIGLGGFVGEEIPFRSTSALPVFDPETNECRADWKNWAIMVDDKVLHFCPTKDDYAAAGISINSDPGPASLTEADLMRYAAFSLGEQLFLDDQQLLSRFPKCQGLSKFLQTMEWQHPDIARGAKPSENVAIRSLVQALAAKDVSLFNPGQPNTDWKSWTQTP